MSTSPGSCSPASGAVFESLARVGQALGHAKRLQIVNLLAQVARTVEELAALTGQSVVTTSAQLKVLREAGLIESMRQGRHVINRLTGDDVAMLWQHLGAVGRVHLPEVRERVPAPPSPVDRVAEAELDEVCRAAARDELLLIDLRPVEEFAAAHLPAARSVPWALLEDTVAQFPPGLPVVAYCRGPFCATAADAVSWLQHHGVAARLLELGVPEWRNSGRPLISSPPNEKVRHGRTFS